MFRTKVTDTWRITDQSDVIRKMAPEALKRATTKIGIMWQKIATDIVTKKNIVDTGELRSRLTYRARENYVKVSSPVKYSRYVELGTEKMKARPFIVPAIKDNGEIYETIVRDEYKSMLASRIKKG